MLNILNLLKPQKCMKIESNAQLINLKLKNTSKINLCKNKFEHRYFCNY